jgi:hypothetical protein
MKTSNACMHESMHGASKFAAARQGTPCAEEAGSEGYTTLTVVAWDDHDQHNCGNQRAHVIWEWDEPPR